jgi:polysaccharide biosynthesis/export protein
MNRLLHLLLTLLLLGSVRLSAEEHKPDPKSPDALDYRIQPLDVLRVQVFQEQDMSAEVRVSKEGSIVMHLLGAVKVSGLRTDEATRLIEKLYRENEILLSPSVSIAVLGYTSQSVNVLGAVNQPGAVQLPPEQRFFVLDAITKAGGFSHVANLRKLRIIRRDGTEGKVKVIELDLEKFIKGEKDLNIRLEPEDVIFVPETNF